MPEEVLFQTLKSEDETDIGQKPSLVVLQIIFFLVSHYMII